MTYLHPLPYRPLWTILLACTPRGWQVSAAVAPVSHIVDDFRLFPEPSPLLLYWWGSHQLLHFLHCQSCCSFGYNGDGPLPLLSGTLCFVNILSGSASSSLSMASTPSPSSGASLIMIVFVGALTETRGGGGGRVRLCSNYQPILLSSPLTQNNPYLYG